MLETRTEVAGGLNVTSGNDLIDVKKRVLKILEYCRRHAIQFTARSSELMPVEMRLSLVQVAPVLVDAMGSFEAGPNRELGLVTKLKSSSHDPELPLPSSIFSVSFQYRTIGHSFHSLLLKFIPCARIAIFSMPRGIYTHRLREEVRFPVLPEETIRIKVNSFTLDVINISTQGLAAVSRGTASFRRGQILPGLSLVLPGQIICATGTVRHVTKIPDERYLYGISLEFPDAAENSKMRELVVLRQQVLSDAICPPAR